MAQMFSAAAKAARRHARGFLDSFGWRLILWLAVALLFNCLAFSILDGGTRLSLLPLYERLRISVPPCGFTRERSQQQRFYFKDDEIRRFLEG